MTRAWRQNGAEIGPSCVPGRLVAFPKAGWFEIKAILLSFGFDRFGPVLRQKSLKERRYSCAFLSRSRPNRFKPRSVPLIGPDPKHLVSQQQSP